MFFQLIPICISKIKSPSGHTISKLGFWIWLFLKHENRRFNIFPVVKSSWKCIFRGQNHRFTLFLTCFRAFRGLLRVYFENHTQKCENFSDFPLFWPILKLKSFIYSTKIVSFWQHFEFLKKVKCFLEKNLLWKVSGIRHEEVRIDD